MMYEAINSFAVNDNGDITGQVFEGDIWEYMGEEKDDHIVLKNYYDLELVIPREKFVRLFEVEV